MIGDSYEVVEFSAVPPIRLITGLWVREPHLGRPFGGGLDVWFVAAEAHKRLAMVPPRSWCYTASGKGMPLLEGAWAEVHEW